jgi:hypothetical protein
MKTRHSILIEQSAARNSKPQVRFLRLQNLLAQERRLPVGRNTARAIVLHLSTTFPACAWAFVKML